MSKQSIMDRVTAAKHSIAGQGLAKVVCKATTEEVMGPKKKHLDYLLQCTNEPNVSIPQLADLLIERTQHANWVVVYKSLITIHNLMNYGNERFTQYLASNNCSFNLGSFIDKGGVQGYDMSTFIRRYSKYLNEKAVSYRQMAFDFCKVRRGKDDGLLRTMNADKLLKTLPALQRQIDSLLEFDCSPNELSNGVVNACFLLMFKDLIRLFACYNDGIINLLEKYFDMNKKQCKEALDIYKRFLVRMDKVSEFLKTAEQTSASRNQSVGIEKSDIPDLAKGLKENTKSAPSSLLDALEQHYQALDGKKGVQTPVTGAKPSGFAAAINTISSNTPEIQVSEEEKKRILDEENARLQQLKDHHATSPTDFTNQEQRLKELGNQPQTATATQNNPFITGPPQTNANNTGGDLFSSPSKAQDPLKPSDDLLSLTGNPFVQNVQNVMAMNSATMAMNSQNSFGAPAWNAGNPNVPASSGGFTSDVDFDKVFHNSQPQTTGPLTDTVSAPGMLQPSSSSQTSVSASQDESLDSLDPFLGGASTMTTGSTMAMGGIFSVDDPIGSGTNPAVGGAPMGGTLTAGGPGGTPPLLPNPVFASSSLRASPAAQGRSSPSSLSEGSGFDAFGEVLQPNTGSNDINNKSDDRLINRDLDTSLVQLAGNLNIKGTAQQVKKQQHEWQPKGEQKKTGGQNWQNQPAISSTTWTSPYTPPIVNSQPVMTGQPMMGSPAMGYGAQTGMMQPGMMGVRPMGMNPVGIQQPGMGMPMAGMGMQPVMYGGMQPMGGVMQQPRPPTGTTSQANDPFGAL